MGSFGDVAVFAFYPNKQITTGEGGMVVTDDPELADTMRSLRNQGRDTDGTWLRHVGWVTTTGWTSCRPRSAWPRWSGCAELQAGRARVVAAYERALGGRDWLRLPRPGPARSSTGSSMSCGSTRTSTATG